MVVDFKPGFILTVDSWENDADSPATKSKHFRNLDDAKMEIGILAQFAKNWGNAYNDWGDVTKDNRGKPFDASEYSDEQLNWIIGNDPDFDNVEIIASIRDVKHPDHEENNGMIWDIIQDTIVSPLMGSSEVYSCRVLDAWSIHEVKEPVSFKRVANGSKYD